MEKQKEMWPFVVSVTIIAVGIGCYFGVTLYQNMQYVFSGGHIVGIHIWIRYVGHWLIEIGALAVVLALLWRLLRKHW